LTIRSLPRALCASTLTVWALLAAQPTTASSKITVDGWRVNDAGGFLDVSSTRELDPPIRLRARLADTELDQTVPRPSGPLTVRIDGALGGGGTRLVLEWLRGGQTVASKQWALKETKSGTRVRVAGSPPADSLRLALLVPQGSEALLESIKLESPDGQALVNPNLVPRGCSPTARTAQHPVGPVEIPRWRRRYGDTTIGVRGSAIVLRSVRLTGIDQYMRAPKGAFRVTVEGAAKSVAYALLEFKRASAPRPGPQLGEAVAHQDLVPLRFRRGQATVQGRTPLTRHPLYLGLALIARGRRPELELRQASLRHRGRQVLRNPDLAQGLCPAGAQRPAAAGTLPAPARWPLTALIIVAGAVLIAMTMRNARGRPAGPKAEPIFKLVLVGVALTPLVSVGTFKLGVRLIPADLVLTIAAAGGFGWLELRRVIAGDPYRLGAVTAAAILVAVAAVGLVLAILHTDANLSALLTREQLKGDLGPPLQRGVVDEVRLLQGVLTFAVLAALLTNPERWKQCARVFVVAAGAAALYGVCQVLGQKLLGSVPQPPGSFPYPELLRASSTFPEPTAFGGYAVVAAALAAVVWRLAPSRVVAAALGLLLVGAALSASSAALLGLVIFTLGVSFSVPRRALPWLGLVAVAAVALCMAVVGVGRTTSVVEKPLGSSNSVLDRRVTWSAALHMGSAYAPIGVGRGQFAYNVAPFIEPMDALRSGRAQSSLLEVWSEDGPLGIALCLALAAVAGLALGNAGPDLDRVSRRLLWTALATLGAVFTGYYTSSYVWPWVVLALLVTASSALSDATAAEASPRASRSGLGM
jgi:hypothetical protein